jgi:plastocyanin
MAVLASLVACGGGDGGTPPVTVSQVVITSPASAPVLHSLGLTIQFAAEARSSAGVPISGKTITWTSSATSVATINASGLMTVVGNGLTSIRASADGVQSTAVSVTVGQVAKAVAITPASLAFGAIGSTHQLTASVTDSNNQGVQGSSVTWTRAGPGTTATVSGTGLVTATAIGIGDSAVATYGTLSGKAPITVTQVVASFQVTTPAGDSVLRTTGRTRQFAASVRDSNNNVIPATFGWSSNAAAVASVDASTGLVTSGSSDGTATITASSSPTGSLIMALRSQVVSHYPDTLTISPTSASITTQGGTQLFTGYAKDSVGTTVSIGWLSKSTAILTVSPSTGTSTTATATGNGTSYVVISGGTRRDSAQVTVTGQPTAPMAISVTIGNDFFKSDRNNTQPALDTLAVNGTVTWTMVSTGAIQHSVHSTGSPSFTSSGLLTASGQQYMFLFTAPGTYTYDCIVHGASMSGTVVVVP